MINLISKNQNGSLSELDIASFENRYGVALPVEYRLFLLEYNGGEPEDHVIKFVNQDLYDYLPRSEQSSRVRFFYSIGTNLPYWIDLEYTVKLFGKRIPAELLPIGSDEGGNQWCLGVKGDVSGQIFYWDHEFEHDAGESDYHNVTKVAEIFEDFLKL